MSRIEDALAKASQARQNRDDSKNEELSSPETNSTPAAPDKSISRWPYILGMAAILAVCLVVFNSAKKGLTPIHSTTQISDLSTKSKPAVEIPKKTKTELKTGRFPTSIQISTLDKVYSSTHPGWERYQARTMEYRVFREAGAVKAIQVISRQKNAITDDFFKSFLFEIAGKDSFKIESVDKKEEHYLEKGLADATTEVVIYREKPSKEISAIVIAFR